MLVAPEIMKIQRNTLVRREKQKHLNVIVDRTYYSFNSCVIEVNFSSFMFRAIKLSVGRDFQTSYF